MNHDRIEAAYRAVLGAWNRRDADGFAALFTEGGHAVGFDGSVMNGRAEIASILRGVFTSERTGAYVARVSEIREIAPDVVLLRSIVGMIPAEVLDLHLHVDLTVNAVQSVVFVRQGEEVRIALLQSTPASFRGRPEVADALMQELEEMLRDRSVKH